MEFSGSRRRSDDLLGVLELSYKEGETHWKHGGIVGVFGYGGGVIGRYCDQPEMFPGVAHFHTVRVAQPSGKYYSTEFLRGLCDIWETPWLRSDHTCTVPPRHRAHRHPDPAA